MALHAVAGFSTSYRLGRDAFEIARAYSYVGIFGEVGVAWRGALLMHGMPCLFQLHVLPLAPAPSTCSPGHEPCSDLQV